MTQEEIAKIKGDLHENLVLYKTWLSHLVEKNLIERSLEAINELSANKR